jgi:hypothetical protein
MDIAAKRHVFEIGLPFHRHFPMFAMPCSQVHTALQTPRQKMANAIIWLGPPTTHIDKYETENFENVG